MEIDNLHQTIETILTHKEVNVGSNAFVAYQEMMLGEALVGDDSNNYLYVGEHPTVVHWMYRTFRSKVGKSGILLHNDTTNSCSLTVGLVNGQTYKFTTAEAVLSHCVRGCSYDRIFLNVNRAESTRGHIESLIVELTPSLIKSQGDIV